MKNLIALSLLSILVTSCVSIDGNLTVTEKMTLKKKGGFLNLGRKNVDIDANIYDAHVTVLGENNFALILQRGDERISIPIKSKNNLKVPTVDGEIRISHSDIDQPYDLKGLINTDVSYSPSQESIDACTWYTTEQRCQKICDSNLAPKDANGGERKPGDNHAQDPRGQDGRGQDGRGGDTHEPQKPVCRIECHDEQIAHNGRQEVQFHYTTTNRDLSFQFLKADSENSVAHFVGHSTETEKVVEHTGMCR